MSVQTESPVNGSEQFEQDVELFKTLGEKAANIVEQICQLEEEMGAAHFSEYGLCTVQQAGILMVGVDHAFKETNKIVTKMRQMYKEFEQKQEKGK